MTLECAPGFTIRVINHRGDHTIDTSSYLRLVRASAWYDLVSTIGFATPWTFAMVFSGLNALSAALGMSATLPHFAPEHMLMANLLGSLVTVWAILRLRDTRVLYGRQ